MLGSSWETWQGPLTPDGSTVGEGLGGAWWERAGGARLEVWKPGSRTSFGHDLRLGSYQEAGGVGGGGISWVAAQVERNGSIQSLGGGGNNKIQ